jgi:hypothetical protein
MSRDIRKAKRRNRPHSTLADIFQWLFHHVFASGRRVRTAQVLPGNNKAFFQDRYPLTINDLYIEFGADAHYVLLPKYMKVLYVGEERYWKHASARQIETAIRKDLNWQEANHG